MTHTLFIICLLTLPLQRNLAVVTVVISDALIYNVSSALMLVGTFRKRKKKALYIERFAVYK